MLGRRLLARHSVGMWLVLTRVMMDPAEGPRCELLA